MRILCLLYTQRLLCMLCIHKGCKQSQKLPSDLELEFSFIALVSKLVLPPQEALTRLVTPQHGLQVSEATHRALTTAVAGVQQHPQ